MTHLAKFICRSEDTIHVAEKLSKFIYLEGNFSQRFSSIISSCEKIESSDIYLGFKISPRICFRPKQVC